MIGKPVSNLAGESSGIPLDEKVDSVVGADVMPFVTIAKKVVSCGFNVCLSLYVCVCVYVCVRI